MHDDGDVGVPKPGIAAQNGVNHNNNHKSPSSWRRQPLQNGNVRSKTLSYARSIVASIEEEHDSLYTSMDEEDSLPETAPKKSISTPRLRVSVGPMPNRVPVVPPSLDYSAFPSSLRQHSVQQLQQRQQPPSSRQQEQQQPHIVHLQQPRSEKRMEEQIVQQQRLQERTQEQPQQHQQPKIVHLQQPRSIMERSDQRREEREQQQVVHLQQPRTLEIREQREEQEQNITRRPQVQPQQQQPRSTMDWNELQRQEQSKQHQQQEQQRLLHQSSMQQIQQLQPQEKDQQQLQQSLPKYTATEKILLKPTTTIRPPTSNPPPPPPPPPPTAVETSARESRERTGVQYGCRKESDSRAVPPPPPRPSEERLQQVRRQRSSSQPPELTRQRLREFTQTYENGSRVAPSDTASVASSRGSSSFLASGVRSDRTTSLRSQWEAACVKDESDARQEALRVSRSRGYSFPKWRSNDALSASLVASNEKGAVHIPVDSRIPEDRQKKMIQTEMEARETKVLIHREANLARKPSLHRGRSVDAVNIQLDHSPWYDEREIRGGIERESIGNLQRTRARFETPTHSTANSRLTSPQPPQPTATAHPRRLIIDERSSPPSSEHRSTPPQQQMARVAPSSHLGGSSLSLSSRLSPEEARLVQFLRQNAQVATSLGISIPPDLMRDVITSYAHSEPVQSIKYEEFPSSMTSSYRRTEVMASEQQISPVASSTSSDHRYASRRPMSPTRFPRRHEIVRGVPENRREAAQALEGRYGADLIAAELRLQKEREEDLRRSRSQLGLPDLHDTLQLWRQGYRGLSTNCLASASSFDHGLNHEFGRMSKAQSITELSFR